MLQKPNRIPIICAGIIILLALVLLAPVTEKPVSAAPSSVNSTTLRESNVTLSFGNDSTSIPLEAKKSGDTLGQINLHARVSVENSGGYDVSIKAENADLMSGSNKIKAMSGKTTFEQIPVNTWGYYAGKSLSGAQYQATPTTNTRIHSKSGENITESEEILLSFATKINAETPAGNYANKIILSVVSQPGIVATFGGISTMQELTPTICKAASENDTAYLKDTRDNNYYWVTKLADGNCWMSQNLALDLTKDVPVEGSIVNTDGTVSAYSYTPEASTATVGTSGRYSSTTSKCIISGNYVCSWDEGRYIVIKPSGASPVDDAIRVTADDGLEGFANLSDNTTFPGDASSSRVTYTVDGVEHDGIVVDVSGADWKVATDPNFTTSSSYAQNGNSYNKTAGWAIDPVNKVYDAHYLVGNYYQWYAATAQAAEGEKKTTDGDIITTSVCPAGWRLPTSGYAHRDNGSFYNLLKNYGNLAATWNNGVTLPSGTDATDNISESPLFFNRIGRIDTGWQALVGVGTTLSTWSGIVRNETFAYYLDAGNAAVAPSFGGRRSYGLPVRCLVLVPEETTTE